MFSSHIHPFILHRRGVSNPTPLQPCGLAYFKLSCVEEGLSEETITALFNSIDPKSLSIYKRHWKNFVLWPTKRTNSIFILRNLIFDYPLHLYNQGLSSRTLNSIRSALSFFTSPQKLDLASDIYVNRLFRYFYRNRPRKAKYLVHWPVSKLLSYLKS